MYLRDAGGTEIGGFGVTAPEDLLLIEEIALVQQSCTSIEVAFDDGAVADFFDEQVDLGLKPEQFARVWIHTHPGQSAQPSATDEETFARVFGSTDWAVMFILAQGGQTYARLRYHLGPGAEVQLPVEVDFSRPFDGSDEDQWQAEYEACVEEMVLAQVRPVRRPLFSHQELAEDRPLLEPSARDWPEGESPQDQWTQDEWYEAWLDYVDPSEFPREVNHAVCDG